MLKRTRTTSWHISRFLIVWDLLNKHLTTRVLFSLYILSPLQWNKYVCKLLLLVSIRHRLKNISAFEKPCIYLLLRFLLNDEIILICFCYRFNSEFICPLSIWNRLTFHFQLYEIFIVKQKFQREMWTILSHCVKIMILFFLFCCLENGYKQQNDCRRLLMTKLPKYTYIHLYKNIIFHK